MAALLAKAVWQLRAHPEESKALHLFPDGEVTVAYGLLQGDALKVSYLAR